MANQATSTHAGDGLRLVGARVVAAVRCAPPANRPTAVERDTCALWLDREVALVLDTMRCVVALGSFAWDTSLRTLEQNGFVVPRPRPRFRHGAEAFLHGDHGTVRLLGCYHPSQQNTFTGRLTEAMLDDVLTAAAHS